MLQHGRPDVRVLTFVFYHCRGTGGIRKRQYRLGFYEESVHEIGYWTVGVGDLDAQEYAARDNPIAWALAAWMRQPRTERAGLRLRLLDKILRLVQDVVYRRLLLDAVRSYFTLSRVEQAEEQQLLQSGAYGEVREMLDTELGRLEHAAESRGETRALRTALVAILESRFTIIPEEITTRIDRLERPVAIERLIRRASVAESLEEIERLLPPLEE
jgi:hypothetical protein